MQMLVGAGAVLPYRDAAQPVNARVADLLARMSTEEKVAQLLNPFSSADAVAKQYATSGVGGAWGERLPGGDRKFANVQDAQNWLQETVINGSRHGIPVSVYVEGLHGGPGGGTIFPSPVNMGSSWNVSLLKMVGAAVGHEARLGGCDRVFAPELQVDTDARFGRFYESFSEDPHLVSVYGYFMTQGIQGPIAAADSYLGNTSAACEAKHMAAYGNAGKDGAASEVSEATFFNKYWPPWIMYAKAGGRGVMPSHQLTTAFMLPSHANRFMITGLWRGVLGMNETFVSSDCGDIGELSHAFHLATDPAEAAAVALNAGVDQDLCVSTYDKGIAPALERGLITNATLDASVSNILRQKFAAGLFEGR
jgi:beta-glucosidase